MNDYRKDVPKNDWSKLILLLIIGLALLLFGMYNLNDKVEAWTFSRWDYIKVKPQDIALPLIGAFVLIMANNERKKML